MREKGLANKWPQVQEIQAQTGLKAGYRESLSAGDRGGRKWKNKSGLLTPTPGLNSSSCASFTFISGFNQISFEEVAAAEKIYLNIISLEAHSPWWNVLGVILKRIQVNYGPCIYIQGVWTSIWNNKATEGYGQVSDIISFAFLGGKSGSNRMENGLHQGKNDRDHESMRVWSKGNRAGEKVLSGI